MNNIIDTIDSEIILKRSNLYNKKWCEPRVGDVVIRDGYHFRIAKIWFGESFQMTLKDDPGSFYLNDSGEASYSGGLGENFPLGRLVLTNVVLDGDFWIFRHNKMRAHNVTKFQMGVSFYLFMEERKWVIIPTL